MRKYRITIEFTTDRELSEGLLRWIAAECVVQVEELKEYSVRTELEDFKAIELPETRLRKSS